MDLLERAVDALKAGRTVELDRPLDHGAEIDLGLPALLPAPLFRRLVGLAGGLVGCALGFLAQLALSEMLAPIVTVQLPSAKQQAPVGGCGHGLGEQTVPLPK